MMHSDKNNNLAGFSSRTVAVNVNTKKSPAASSRRPPLGTTGGTHSSSSSAPLPVPQASLNYAKRLHSQRPQSVEADVQLLSNLREELVASRRSINDIVDEERRARHDVEVALEASYSAIARDYAKRLSYVHYLDSLKAKEKTQHELTQKVHELFVQTIDEEKQQKQRKRMEQHLEKVEVAQAVRQRFHASDFHDKQQQRVHELRQQVQAARAEDHHRRYAKSVRRKFDTAVRAVQIREEELERRREKIVETAVQRHEKRKLVSEIRANSTSPTVFLRLPPMREVFEDDVLSFDTQTILTRHYHSMYAGTPLSATSQPNTRSQGGWADESGGRNSVGIGTD